MIWYAFIYWLFGGFLFLETGRLGLLYPMGVGGCIVFSVGFLGVGLVCFSWHSLDRKSRLRRVSEPGANLGTQDHSPSGVVAHRLGWQSNFYFPVSLVGWIWFLWRTSLFTSSSFLRSEWFMGGDWGVTRGSWGGIWDEFINLI